MVIARIIIMTTTTLSYIILIYTREISKPKNKFNQHVSYTNLRVVFSSRKQHYCTFLLYLYNIMCPLCVVDKLKKDLVDRSPFYCYGSMSTSSAVNPIVCRVLKQFSSCFLASLFRTIFFSRCLCLSF